MISFAHASRALGHLKHSRFTRPYQTTTLLLTQPTHISVPQRLACEQQVLIGNMVDPRKRQQHAVRKLNRSSMPRFKPFAKHHSKGGTRYPLVIGYFIRSS